MSLKSVNKLTILGFGRMGKAMVSGWLDNDLQSDSINIIDPNIGPVRLPTPPKIIIAQT